MSIVVESITKVYGEQKAVNDISFTVNRGEVVGFLGPNGAGKSTTMKMITGYLKPDAGNIKVCDVDVLTDTLNGKKKIGYLPEANPLYYDMYVKEYLGFVAGVFKIQDSKSKIKNVIEQTGLDVECHKKIGQLSKGYKQRTGLAAALLHEPEVLILDEPTSGLDPNQVVEIRNLIKEQGKNKTVLFSSHILQEVEAVCDRVIIINKGKMVADDSLLNLKKNSLSQSVKIIFKEEVNEEIFKGLRSAKSFTSNGNNEWMIESNNADAVRKELLQLAVEKNLNIVSLQNTGSNLEEIFRSLTASI